MCLQGAPVASDGSDGSRFIGGKEGGALALQAGEKWKSLEAWCFDSGSFLNMSHIYEKLHESPVQQVRACR